jgi:hypothetical protein
MIIHGLSVNFGIGSILIGVNGAFQSRDHGIRIESEVVKDGGETTVSKVYWDQMEEATFTYVAVNVVNNYSNAAVTFPSVGYWCSISDYQYPAISGDWLVDDVQINSSNTTAARVTVKLSRYPYLQHF